MLNLLDETLSAFLRKTVPLPAREVDIVFDAPDGEWAAGVSRPTVNLYLWDVRPNLAEREYGEELIDPPTTVVRVEAARPSGLGLPADARPALARASGSRPPAGRR